jgi:hypothetical protein
MGHQVYLNIVSCLSKYGQFLVRLSIRIRPSEFMNVTMCELRTLTIRFLDVAKFTALNPLSLQISCKLSFPIVGLQMSSLLTLALKSPSKIFV